MHCTFLELTKDQTRVKETERFCQNRKGDDLKYGVGT